MSSKHQPEQSQKQANSGLPDYARLRTLDLWRVLAEQNLLHPDKEALVLNQHRFTYRKLTEKAEQCAAGLYHLGLRQGDKLAVVLPNWSEFVVAFFAAARLGAVLVPLNVRYRRSEMEFMLRDCGAKFLITCAEFHNFNYLAMWHDLRPVLPNLEHGVVVGQGAGSPGMVSWESLLGEGAKAVHMLPQVPIEADKDPAAILYTSGATGAPKGAMLSHSNLLYGALIAAERLQLTSADKVLATVPLFNIFGICPTLLAAIGSGASLVLMDIFSPEGALDLVQREQITILHGVPTMFILELSHPNFPHFDTSSLRTGFIAAAPASAEIIGRIRTRMGCDILSAYGMTETSASLTSTHFEDDDKTRSETVGRPSPGVEIKIVDENNEVLPPGQVGELVCRSPGLMLGYYNRPEATVNAIDLEGWFYTGDLATMSETSVVKIVGRKKDMINRGGFKIFPREVEELYYLHPKVQEVVVLGTADPVLGERSCACIQLRSGQSATVEEMREYIAEKLADYKVPDTIYFLEKFPMTASGKIKKMQLKSDLGL